MISHSEIFIFLLVPLYTITFRFPQYIPKCHQNDPDVKHCYIKALNLIKSHFNIGIPEFRLPPMNPLVLPEITLEDESMFRATFKNIKIYHLEELKINDMEVNFANNRFKVNITIPRLRIKSDYNLQGRIIFLQLNGNGPADGNFTNVEVEVELIGTRYKKGNKEYIKFIEMKIIDKLHGSIFSFDGLFKDNPELTKQINKVVNENIDEIINELRPTIHVAIKKTVLGLISPMFKKFSIEDFFPE